MNEPALFAGSAATAIFVIGQLPMLIKAARTKDLSSYSFANIGLANVGNALYTAYVVSVPIGPLWALHGFNLFTSGLMLFWYLRYGRRSRAAGPSREELTPLARARYSGAASQPVGPQT